MDKRLAEFTDKVMDCLDYANLDYSGVDVDYMDWDDLEIKVNYMGRKFIIKISEVEE